MRVTRVILKLFVRNKTVVKDWNRLSDAQG